MAGIPNAGDLSACSGLYWGESCALTCSGALSPTTSAIQCEPLGGPNRIGGWLGGCGNPDDACEWGSRCANADTDCMSAPSAGGGGSTESACYGTAAGGTCPYRGCPAGTALVGGEFACEAGSWQDDYCIQSSSEMWIWGGNTYLSLGPNHTALPKTGTPLPFNSLHDVVAAWVFEESSFAVTRDGFYAWGHNWGGFLGDRTLDNRPGPVRIGLEGVVDVAGFEHTLALTRDGAVYATGRNTKGQLGVGDTTMRTHFTRVTLSGAAVGVAVGIQHSAVLLTDGSVWTMGRRNRIGDGGTTITAQSTPVQIIASGAKAIAAGEQFTVVLLDNGTTISWGANSDSQLCVTGADRFIPTVTSGLPPVVDISCGLAHGIARAADGTVWTWGRGSEGQIGDGTFTDRSTAYQVVGVENVVAISAGFRSSMAIRADNTLMVWGINSEGQLGDSTFALRGRPAASLFTGVAYVHAGSYNTVALTVANTLTTTMTSPTAAALVPFELLFSLYGTPALSAGDIDVVGGSVADFTAYRPRFFTFNVVPDGSPVIVVRLVGGLVDEKGFIIDIDPVVLGYEPPPTSVLSYSGAVPASDSPIPLRAVFSLPVNLSSDAFDVAGGSVVPFAYSTGTAFDVFVTPAAEGNVTVVLPGDVAMRIGGSFPAGNIAAPNNVLVLYDIRPMGIVTSTASSTTTQRPIPFTITFSKPVVGFDVADVIVNGGSVVSFAGDGSTFEVTIEPAGQGSVMVSVGNGAASSLAGSLSQAVPPYAVFFTCGSCGKYACNAATGTCYTMCANASQCDVNFDCLATAVCGSTASDAEFVPSEEEAPVDLQEATATFTEGTRATMLWVWILVLVLIFIIYTLYKQLAYKGVRLRDRPPVMLVLLGTHSLLGVMMAQPGDPVTRFLRAEALLIGMLCRVVAIMMIAYTSDAKDAASDAILFGSDFLFNLIFAAVISGTVNAVLGYTPFMWIAATVSEKRRMALKVAGGVIVVMLVPVVIVLALTLPRLHEVFFSWLISELASMVVFEPLVIVIGVFIWKEWPRDAAATPLRRDTLAMYLAGIGVKAAYINTLEDPSFDAALFDTALVDLVQQFAEEKTPGKSEEESDDVCVVVPADISKSEGDSSFMVG